MDSVSTLRLFHFLVVTALSILNPTCALNTSLSIGKAMEWWIKLMVFAIVASIPSKHFQNHNNETL